MASLENRLRIIEKLMGLASWMPWSKIVYPARLTGLLWYLTDHHRRTIAHKNLSIAFGDILDEDARTRLCRENFCHIVRVFLELPHVFSMNASNVNRYITIHGAENLYRALEKKRGALVLASHFGNWELMSVGFSLIHFPLDVIARPLENPLANTLITRIRSTGGNRILSKKGSLREILRALHEGRGVAVLLDQNAAAHEGVFVPFFGKTASTHKMMALLALRTRAPVVPVYNVRKPSGRYHMYLDPEIPLRVTGDMETDIRENTSLYNSVMERYIRAYPEQWFWIHRRWKTQSGVPRKRQKAEYGTWKT